MYSCEFVLGCFSIKVWCQAPIVKVFSQWEFLLWFSIVEPCCQFKFLFYAPVLRSWFGVMSDSEKVARRPKLPLIVFTAIMGCAAMRRGVVNWSKCWPHLRQAHDFFVKLPHANHSGDRTWLLLNWHLSVVSCYDVVCRFEMVSMVTCGADNSRFVAGKLNLFCATPCAIHAGTWMLCQWDMIVVSYHDAVVTTYR